MDKGTTYYTEKFKSMNERWFNQKQKNKSKELLTDGNEDLSIQRNMLIQGKHKRVSADTF